MVEENVSGFQVSMKDFPLFPVVALPQSQNNLDEDLPNNIFCNEVFVLLALFNKLGHVSVLAILHDDIDPFVFFVDNPAEYYFKSYLS